MQITPHGDNFYLSSIGGEQALTPPKRHCLGRPLPYQLADTEQAAPKASCDFTLRLTPQRQSGITSAFAELCPTSGCVPAYYYLVCRCPSACASEPLDLHALSTPPAFILS